jgi:hypothetical protein
VDREQQKSSESQEVFHRLRGILAKHAANFAVARDETDRYSLEAPVGPATIRAWGGKARSPRIPVAWVEITKACVSYHLMGVQGNPKLLDGCSPELRARMQGKSCFNFKMVDETVFQDLAQLTAKVLTGMRNAGYVS